MKWWLFLLLPSWALAQGIQELRARCEALTNPDVLEAEGQKLVDERKPVMTFLVRRLCEKQERAYDQQRFPEADSWLTLDTVYHSFIDRHRVMAGIGLIDVLKMGMTHDLSPYVLRFKKGAWDGQGVEPSVFWHAPEAPLSEEFERQWRTAGVNPSVRWMRIDKMEGRGSVPKIHADDLAHGGRWLMKWGDEVHSDPVASRLLAALGFNVDFPFYFHPGEIRLILGQQGKQKRTVRQLVNFIYNSYKVNLSPFIRESATISAAMVSAAPLLAGLEGETYLTFTGLAMEPRPVSETRLGPFMMDLPQNSRRENRAALLAHVWVGNWDTKSDNTLLTVVGDKNPSLKASYSDVGVSLGAAINKFPRDLKAGIVNEFAWDVVEVTNDEVRFLVRMNEIPEAWRGASWSDLVWMAQQLARVSPGDLRAVLAFSGWPSYLNELYFHKLAYRRQALLKAFGVPDPHVWQIDRRLTIAPWIKDGELVQEADLKEYPQGLLHTRGRFRGYGW